MLLFVGKVLIVYLKGLIYTLILYTNLLLDAGYNDRQFFTYRQSEIVKPNKLSRQRQKKYLHFLQVLKNDVG